MIQHAVETNPGVLKRAWPWIRAVSPVAMAYRGIKGITSTGVDTATSVGDAATSAKSIGDTIEDLENSFLAISTVIKAVPDIIITGGVVVASLMGVKFLLKYLEDKRAKEALDARIDHANSILDHVDKMFAPDQEILPRDAIKS